MRQYNPSSCFMLQHFLVCHSGVLGTIGGGTGGGGGGGAPGHVPPLGKNLPFSAPPSNCLVL